MFLGEMHDKKVMRKNKKTVFAAARLFWPEGCFWDFFGLKKAEGLLKAKKNPSNSPKAKTSLAKAKQVFFIPKDEKCRALTLKYHFLPKAQVFPFKK